MIPHAFEALGVAKRRLGDVLVCERQQPRAIFLFLDERLEGDGQAIGRRRRLLHIAGDELRDRLVGHPAHQGVHQPGIGLSFAAFGQQVDERVRRQLTDGSRHVP